MIKARLFDLSGALADYSQSAALNNRMVESLFLRGDAKVALNNQEAAARDHRRALDMDNGRFAAVISQRIERQNQRLSRAGRDDFNYPQRKR